MNKILKFLGYKTYGGKWDIDEMLLDMMVIGMGVVIIYTAITYS